MLRWLPSSLAAEGRSVGFASTLIARSNLIVAPAVLVAASVCSTWSTGKSPLTVIGVAALG